MNENIKTESEQLEDEIQALDAPTTASDGDMMAPPEPLVNTEIKVKRGTGWKVATFIFAVIAILGVGAAAYLFFSDGTTNFLGRKVTSSASNKSATKKQVVEGDDNTDDSDDTTTVATAGKYIYLDGYDYAIKIPDTLIGVNYLYDRFVVDDSFNANYSILQVNAMDNTDSHQSVAGFSSAERTGFSTLGTIFITHSEPLQKGSAPELAFKLEDDLYVYYSHPQAAYSKDKAAIEWEMKSVENIKKMLTSKDNWVKIK